MKNGVENLRGCANQLSGDNKCNHSSCNKLNVYNQYKNLPYNSYTPDIVEIRFKNTRKAFFRNINNLKLIEGDMVAVESSPGHDIGIVSLIGELVIEQMKRKNIPANSDFKKVYRKVKQADIEKWDDAISREDLVMLKSRKIAKRLKLDMKIGDVEFQGDGTKAIFYYIADERVDFRELIKLLADEFKIRIEMRQIGARQEAGRIGGIGSCGRELCCASWMSDFVSVSTDSAREQEISLNPQKLAGQCGKLKCCLNYELKSYKEAKEFFPEKINLKVKDGEAFYMKADIYKGLMWYSFDARFPMNVTSVSIKRVKEVIELNKKGIIPEKLSDGEIVPLVHKSDYNDVVGGDSITRFDEVKPKSNPKKNRKKKNIVVKNPVNPIKNDQTKPVTESPKPTDNTEKPANKNTVNKKKKYNNRGKNYNKNRDFNKNKENNPGNNNNKNKEE